MTLPFFKSEGRRREQVVAIDLGARALKAVHVQRKAEGFELLNYVIYEPPPSDQAPSPATLLEALKSVADKLGARTRQAVLAVGVNDALVRWVELPLVPVGDLRQLLKFNAKAYLQQDLPDHLFDCTILGQAKSVTTGETAKAAPKCRALVTAAKRQLIEDLQRAAKEAGWTVNHVVPGLIGPANAFELARPDLFAKEAVALVDVGFKNSSITIVQDGELKMGRVVSLGSDRLTSGLAEALNISYAEAEGIKIGIPDEVQAPLQALLAPLGRELRASIDFFEHQQDRTVSHVFVSGGAARSPFIVQTLQSEMLVASAAWNPVSFMNLALPPAQLGELEPVAPQLAVSVGAALAAL